MRKRTRKKIKRKAKKFSLKYFWPVLPSLILIILSLALGQSKIFQLKKITCSLADHPCSLEFEPTLVNFTHENIFKIKNSQIAKAIQSIDPSIDQVKIKKHFPNTLIIDLTQRLPVAQLNLVQELNFKALNSTASATFSGQMTTDFFHLDSKGEVFNQSSKNLPQLPLILVDKDLNIPLGSSKISQGLAQAIKALIDYYVSFDLVALIDLNTLVVKTTSGSYAILEAFNSLERKVASLQYILSNIKIGETVPKKIDLRFDKPVLTY